MNCLRSLEFIKKIDKKYRKFGLGTIIIHPPEWEFEKESNNIAYALKKHNIRFPVIIDKNKKIIKRYGIDFWPTQILIMGGKILYKHVGEGNYKALEKKIIRFLQIKAKEIFNKEPVYSKFPTLYAGKRKHGKIADFKKSLKFGIVYKDCTWLQKEEFIQSVGNNNSLIILTKGKAINLVAKSLDKKTIKVDLKIKGKLVKKIPINKPRLYNIAKLGNNKPQELKLIAKRDLAVYSFSFQ